MAAPAPLAAADPQEPTSSRLPTRQLVFLVRHAQSRWNKAQEEMNFVEMMQENDHGLSDLGRQQAELLQGFVAAGRQELDTEPEVPVPEDGTGDWRAFAHQRFFKPDVVYSSPFTRAICTAVIGLKETFPKEEELIVLREAREQKNMGGADSTGNAVGEEIYVRLEEDVIGIYAHQPKEALDAAVRKLQSTSLDLSGVQEAWWGGPFGDPKLLIRTRIHELVARLRQTRGSLPGGGGVATLVAHSLLFRSLFKSNLGFGEGEEQQNFFRTMALHSVPFCGVVGVLLEWDDCDAPRIAQAFPMFGTELLPAQETDQEAPSLIAGAIRSCACTSPKDPCSLM